MKLPTDSLRFRYITSTIVWIAVGLVLTGLMVSALFRIYITQGFHDEMRVHIDELAALARVDREGNPFLLRQLSDPRYGPVGSGYYWQVEREGHRTILSPSLAGKHLSGTLALKGGKSWAVTSGPTGPTLEYGMIQPMGDGGPSLRLSIATDMRLLDAILMEFDWPLGWALAGFAMVMILTGAAQIAYGLRPLQRLADAVGEIRAGRATRMQGTYPSEIQPLVSDLNDLLEANAAMVGKARIEAGNLAHGLRTPLAVILDEAERLAAAGQRETAETLIRESQKMQRQIEYQLVRARSAAVEPTPGQAASLRQTVKPILTAMARLHADRNIALCCGDFPDILVQIDPIDLGEILSSLIDNAVKWACSRAMVGWEPAGEWVRILIDDDGKGIAPVFREGVFAVGKRLDEDIAGSGLGLAIARDLVQLYSGTISLGDSPLGGLRVEILLPIAGRSTVPKA